MQPDLNAALTLLGGAACAYVALAFLVTLFVLVLVLRLCGRIWKDW